MPMGTMGITEIRRLAQQVHNQNGTCLEAPVLGSKPQAANGSLLVMAGGTKELFDQQRPLLDHLSHQPMLVGAIGSGAYVLPLLSTVFYPHVSCAGGELLLADNQPITTGHTGPLPQFRSVITIPPVRNRLVLFSPGLLHRINPLEGERYSVAVNIWAQEPLTTPASAPPV